MLKTWVVNLAPDLGASLWSDLLMAALGEVDWFEIVRADWDDLHPAKDADEGREETP